jgi:threonine dehydrogenase-like Zn-dependent dehydrogenase
MNEDMALLLRYMAAGKLKVGSMFNMVADPKDAPSVYDRLFNRDPELLGVVFDWSNY